MLDKILIAIVKFYKIAFSGKRPSCRYMPTCSTYAIAAISKYGVMRGGFLAVKRILRCRPGLRRYENCGYDPVP